MLSRMTPVVEQHRKNLVPGIPQLNMCDVAVMVRFKKYKYKNPALDLEIVEVPLLFIFYSLFHT